jgi:hypothetical protein
VARRSEPGDQLVTSGDPNGQPGIARIEVIEPSGGMLVPVQDLIEHRPTLSRNPPRVAEPRVSEFGEPGGRVEIPVSLKRLYEFEDAVELTLVAPKEVVGLNAVKVTIPKDQTEAKLVLEASRDATPGENKLTLQAKLKFNNQDLQWDQPIRLKVAAKQKSKD